MKMARLKVTPELLRTALMLPDGVSVIRAETNEHFGWLELILTGDELPTDDTIEGRTIPEIIPMVSIRQHQCGHRTVEVDYTNVVVAPHTDEPVIDRILKELRLSSPAIR